VRKLLLDTNVLLELALFDLARSGNRSARSDLFKTPARHSRFMQEIENRFGRMVYSVGSIIELDRLALSRLTRGNRLSGALDPFWKVFRRLCDELPRRIEPAPIALFDLGSADFRTFAPLDSRLLDDLRSDDELWLASTDDELMKRAASLTRGRVLDPRWLS
jgi:hypothetical protein